MMICTILAGKERVFTLSSKDPDKAASGILSHPLTKKCSALSKMRANHETEVYQYTVLIGAVLSNAPIWEGFTLERICVHTEGFSTETYSNPRSCLPSL